jgi:hypothetical protein
LRCVDNFLPRVSNVEAFGASGFAHGWVSVKADDATTISSATAAGGAGSDPTQNRPTD